MKAMILAAGQGLRMRPLTQDCPKPLLVAGTHRLIEYQIISLKQAGIQDIIINTAYLSNQFPQKLGSGERYGVRIHYSQETVEQYGTGGGVINALPLLGDQPFIITSGDIYTNFPYQTLQNTQLNTTNNLAHIVLVKNPHHHPNGDFYLPQPLHPNASKSNSNSKPNLYPQLKNNGNPKLTFGNIGIYHPNFFRHYPLHKAQLGSFLREAIAKNQVTGEFFAMGYWINITTPKDLSKLTFDLSCNTRHDNIETQ